MNIPKIPFTIFDTETTGLEPGYDHIFELAAVRCEEGEKVAEYESLYAVPKELPLFVQALTRVMPGDLVGKPVINDERAGFEHFFEDTLIIGHNVLFDIGMLKGEGLDLSERPWVDSAMLASIVFPELESYSLPYLSTALELPHEPQHRALGDVHATLALIEKIWTRLSELPAADLRNMQSIAERSPEGYRRFFAAAVAGAQKERPSWLVKGVQPPEESAAHAVLPDLVATLRKEIPEGALHAVTVSLSPSILPSVLEAAQGIPGRTWVCVKNLDATVRTLPATILQGASVVRPAFSLLNPDAVARFREQKTFTSDECTLACKLALYEGSHQSAYPIHGSEYDVWKGKLACIDTSQEYRSQFDDLSTRVLIDQRHLLSCVRDERGPKTGDHIIMDDASMLEDTATKAYQHSCVLDVLRAAAVDHEILTRFLDALQIWIAQVRGELDTRYLTEGDLGQDDVKGLRKRLEEVLQSDLSDQVREHLSALNFIIDLRNLEGRITWVERFRDGGETLHSAPLDTGQLLWENLYDAFPTALLLPPGTRENFPAIIPPQIDVMTSAASAAEGDAPPVSYADPQMTLDRLLPCVDGKVIVLVASKRSIAEMYTKYAVALEDRGITFIAEGSSGGKGRMQAEFRLASAPAVWMLTPWTYESVDLPQGTVDRLLISAVPFDHPNHIVLSRRSERYGNGFTDYMFPRMLHRVFRLLRAFAWHRTPEGDVLILDDRLRTKEYGKAAKKYLETITLTPVVTPRSREG